MAGFSRTVFCLRIPDNLFDVTFNSEFGLRGAYFQSVHIGEEFNRLLIKTVSQKLIEWPSSNNVEFDTDQAARSLNGMSAKVWLAEKTLHLCANCEGEWSSDLTSDVTISNGRWELDTHMHAHWGRMAHHFKKIRVFGAFVNSDSEEYIAEHKRDRSQHIFDWGWT